MSEIKIQEPQDDPKSIEKAEEAKLKAKYPQVARPGPQFLQKRLTKGQKYFDSGDYNMAKQQPKLRLPASSLSNKAAADAAAAATAAAAAGGDSAGPGGKPGPLRMPNSGGPSLIPEGGFETLQIEPLSPPTGDTIPTPEIISHRKASIHVQSKLVSSPQ